MAKAAAMLKQALDLCEEAIGAASAISAARAIDRSLRTRGASYVQVRLYHRPRGILSNNSHWAAGGVLLRSCIPGWEGSPGFDLVCFHHNPLLNVIRHGYTRYRFSDLAPFSEKSHGAYWEAFSEADIADGIGANAYAKGGRIASIHVGLPKVEMAAAESDLLMLAAGIAAERIARFEPIDTLPPTASNLSVRERDVMRYIANGKTDWEIGVILGIAETTARFHADNARRKLNAVNRIHAVTRFLESCDRSDI